MVLRLEGEIDMATADVVRQHFDLLAADMPARIIIDATDVSFIDSSGLHALIHGKRTLYDAGCQIVLVPSRQVRRTLELVFQSPLFAALVDSIEEAEHYFGEKNTDSA